MMREIPKVGGSEVSCEDEGRKVAALECGGHHHAGVLFHWKDGKRECEQKERRGFVTVE